MWNIIKFKGKPDLNPSSAFGALRWFVQLSAWDVIDFAWWALTRFTTQVAVLALLYAYQPKWLGTTWTQAKKTVLAVYKAPRAAKPKTVAPEDLAALEDKFRK